FEDWQEHQLRGWLYWAPHPRWAFSVDYIYDHWRNEDPPPLATDFPQEVVTHRVPVAAHWFHPSGLFAELRATGLLQDVDRVPGAPIADGTEETVLLDAALGYRLPGRRGIVSLEANNLLDTRFDYQDSNFQSSQTSTPLYLPERTVLVRATLQF
ncbi:MAG TPA: hypothetical protein VFG43_12940, partial [Geminicoccaceae bacterium]|nr:hypothetical protein [Geminicoccaceae bacterium]